MQAPPEETNKKDRATWVEVVMKVPSTAGEVPIFYIESGVCYYYLQWNIWCGMLFCMLLIKGWSRQIIYLTLNKNSDIYSKNDIINKNTVIIIRAKMANICSEKQISCTPRIFFFAWGWLKISRWTFHSCTIFEAYLINSLRFSEV